MGVIVTEDSETGRQHKDFLNEMLMGKGISGKAAAAKINISAERLYKYLNPGAGNNNLPAYLVPIMSTMVSTAYLEWLCAEAGFSAVKLPEADGDLQDAVEAASIALADTSAALLTFSRAIKDGVVTPEEMDKIKRRVIWRRIKDYGIRL